MKKAIVTFLFLITELIFAQEVVITGNINTNTTLTNDKTYLLRGIVRVESGATLTIQAGTKIYGENSTQGSLIIKPGGKINAVGTAQNPIIFTSEFTKPGATRKPTYGDWGGIILLGKAPINVPGGTSTIEGPGDTFGGNDPNDDSGKMQYVRIEYPGIAYSPNNEINGLTFGGVGSKTVIDHIIVAYSGDDSFEWFGGNVNCKYLIAYRGWDDDFDSDYGYSGKLQFLLGIRDPQIADQSSSNGFESDNDGSGSTNTPRTSPTWYNVTLIGPAATKTTQINSLYKRGMHLRRSSQNKIYNALIMGWPDGILIDGTNTVSDAKAGNTFVKNSIISGSVNADFKSTDATFQTDMPNWFTSNGGKVFANNSDVMLNNPFDLEKINPMPKSTSPVFNGAATPPNDGFFDSNAKFIGAFGTTDWASGWSNLNFVPTNIEKLDNDIPTEFSLKQNYPNPFNPTTNIEFTINKEGYYTLKVFNLIGQEIANLIETNLKPGNYKIGFDGKKLSSGVYIYKLSGNNINLARKMIINK